MKTPQYLFALLLLLLTTFAFSQESLSVTTRDGSIVKVKCSNPSIKVETKYGLLEIPIKELISVEYGLHLTDAKNIEIKGFLRDLSDASHAKREEATKKLIELAKITWLHILDWPDVDEETKTRKEKILTKIKENGTEGIITENYDLVATKQYIIKGKVITPLSLSNDFLGKFSLEVTNLKRLENLNDDATSITLDAGKTSNEWVNTGLLLNSEIKYFIKAKGKVDLFPATPGAYVVGPSGYSQNGNQEKFLAGALTGKVDDGEEFLIGGSSVLYNKSGRLSLRITKSPWQNPSSGSYDIKISER